jgi:O-antigen/teichoic acid export membrane protein
LRANRGIGTGTPLARGILGQGALLLSGFAAAQACSFARNAIIGHALSRGDFGVAATITMVLQLLEMLSDAGADRLIVQDARGDTAALCGTVHAVMIARGLLIALALYVGAAPAAMFFGIPEASAAFQTIALVPLVKGFMSFDARRAQRRLDNTPVVAIEVIPQAAALLATLPLLALQADYSAVVWLAVLQAVVSFAASRWFAERRYGVVLDRSILSRHVAFGWPIWLSAFPLLAVMQGDRIIVGRLLGMDALAGFTAAFLVTMVPSLVAAKIGHALLMPLLAGAQDQRDVFQDRFRAMCEAAGVASACYLAFFLFAGGALIALAFGPNYQGLQSVAAWLSLMWALRMLQALPGLAVMALGTTTPLFIAGIVRAAALGLALGAALTGLGLEGIAAAGVLGEAASLLYIAWESNRRVRGLARVFLGRCLVLLPAGLAALGHTVLPSTSSDVTTIAIGAAVSGAIGAALLAGLPRVRAGLTAVMPGIATRPAAIQQG